MTTFLKDPEALLPFSVDWTEWAAGEDDDTITSATWTAPDGITVETSPPPTLVGALATVWLSGGTAGQRYGVTCTVETAAGRIDERTINISVYER